MEVASMVVGLVSLATGNVILGALSLSLAAHAFVLSLPFPGGC